MFTYLCFRNGSNFAPQIQMVHSQFVFRQPKRMLKLQPFQTQPEQVLKIEPQQPLRTKRILKIQSPELTDRKSDSGMIIMTCYFVYLINWGLMC